MFNASLVMETIYQRQLQISEDRIDLALSNGLESSEVNKNEEEVETGDSDSENVEEIPEYDSSTDEDEEPEDGDSSIPELDRRSTFLLGGHDTLWTTSQDQQQIPNVKVDLLVSG